MVEQFKAKHQGTLPSQIVVEPVALVALGLKKSVSPIWQGVKVECREIHKDEIREPGKGTALAVLLDTAKGQLVASDLL